MGSLVQIQYRPFNFKANKFLETAARQGLHGMELRHDSVANVTQIFTIDKIFLTERIGSLPDYLQEEIDEGLRMVLYL